MYKRESILKSYDLAKYRYKSFGIDTDEVMKQFSKIAFSLHCWQGDDVRGFEGMSGVASQNLVTGNFPGAARNGDELRHDIDTAFSMSPTANRVNLHSMYAEPTHPKERNEVTSEDFKKWIDWAVENGYGLDFNTSYFTHPMMIDGFSLSSRRKDVRDYWVKAGINSLEISEAMAKATGTPCYNNIWIPDGLKDNPANRMIYRENLKDSLDRILKDKDKYPNVKNVLEGKLFAIGVECFTVGSHEFYLSYAAKNGVGVCMDTGHYHPTETVTDKLSSVVSQVNDVLLHISRGVRWDSDHVLIQSDDLSALMAEMKRGELFQKVAMGLDYFDASINRVAAWVIGLRSAGKALLSALLEPSQLIEKAEAEGDFTSRLALSEEFKNLPVNAVWDMLCVRNGVPVGDEWIEQLKNYEMNVQLKR